ncbi:MAG TPA: hypothetical protein VMW24_03760 [Sedimentisphaerales bacterium]|nr:hypothetical protein [Sedimentisphaerales bacterium]
MKVRSWHYATNNNIEFQIGDVICIEQPLRWAIIEWLVDRVITWPCAALGCIRFPDWFPSARDDDYPDELHTLGEWYGDMGQFYHLKVCDPIYQWLWRVRKRKEWTIELGYKRLAEVFGKDFDFEPVWDDIEERHGSSIVIGGPE